ncbi:alpha/beta hydrolase [Cellulomonas alba]|uniref:Alpha/beta hydrolase n=1 Tax=Cellulomonas alba TaxID=3053467 RepID=A0ABT7SGF8_9CELL|nr:alpha/beta hydrolase [Cellulomonas alba]MDM7855282.1 alpha/beta hydrolase [Cellulomonas alba]
MPMTRPSAARAGVVAGLLAAVLALAGCTGGGHTVAPSPIPTPSATAASPSPDLARFYDQTISWKKCAQGSCGTVEVPLDYANPTGDTINLAVAREASTGKHPVGSLLMNPGGPGVSGVDFLKDVTPQIPKEIRAAYDLVSFDPRGVQRSAPVHCVDDKELDHLIEDDVDKSTPAGLQAFEASWQSFSDGCRANMGAELAHIDTVSAARDLDVLRGVLGDASLAYLGFSYGTNLGATYAALFPQRVGRMVLDGAMPPTLTSDEITIGQAKGFEQELRAYVEDCQGGKGCPLTGDVQHGLDQITSLLDHATASPLPTGTSRNLTGSLAYNGIGQALYATKLWPTLTRGLTEAIKQGTGRILLALADFYTDRAPDGTYTTNTMQAFPAISCTDTATDSSPAAMTAQAAELAKVAPTVAPYFSYGALQCKHWPVPAVGPLPSYAAQGAPPILVVGTTGDPATPYPWAQQMAEMLSSARLLTYVGNGHTAYLSSNSCVNGAVDRYLLTGSLPAEGKRC